MDKQPIPRKSISIDQKIARYLIGLNWALMMNSAREYEKMEPKQ